MLIADDHALFRRGLRFVLNEASDIEIIGEASDGLQAVNLVQELNPDVVLMDVRMPRQNGIVATEKIMAEAPEIKVLMLSVSEEERDVLGAIEAGACGYLLKEISIEEIAAAVRSAARGFTLISPSVATFVARAYRELAAGVRSLRPWETTMSALTPREISVLQLVAEGCSNREVAERLFIAENTVKNHVRNILEKLHVHSRTEAVLYAERERLLEPRLRTHQ